MRQLGRSRRLAGEEAAVLRRALVAAATVLREADGDDEARWADALVLLADTLLSCGPRPRSAPERSEVVVHVDADALAAPAAAEPGACVATDRGTPPAVDVARRLCCDARLWLDAHHVQHWADGGDTSLDNLVLLCHHHHKLVHEGGYRVEPEDARSGSVAALLDGNRHSSAT